MSLLVMRARAVVPLTLAVLSAAASARANGKFPFADQIAVDPTSDAHLVVRTSFGLLVTKDGGTTWDWICEEAMGYADYEPGLAVAGNGAMVLGVQTGVTVGSPDACAFSASPDVTVYAPDVSGVRGRPHVAVAITSLGGADPVARVWRSADDGASFAPLGIDLPKGVLPTTIDVAASDPDVVYVSGLVGPAGDVSGVLVRSDDAGASWASFPIARASVSEPPYIAAVDPNDASVVYVRLGGQKGRLLVTKNGGASFDEVFGGAGVLSGFALSPDGTKVLVGGNEDGIWRADAATLAFEKVATVGARCLAWTGRGVYACGDDFLDGFFIGRSDDEGSTFVPLLQKACLKGPLRCGAGTDVGATCPTAWPAVADQLDAIPCTLGASGAAAGTGASGSSAGSGPSANGLEAGEGGDGCACRVPAGNGPDPFVSALVAIAALARGVRRRRQRACSDEASVISTVSASGSTPLGGTGVAPSSAAPPPDDSR